MSLEGEVTRQEVRPGLVIVRRRTMKDDGRYLIYYDFQREALAAVPGSPAGAAEKGR